MTEAETTPEDKTIRFYPEHVRSESRVALGLLGVVMVIGLVALFRPIGLGDPADPMVTPAHTKPEWYFLFLYQLLKYVPKVAGVLIPILGVVVLALWPFFDRRKDTHRARRIRVVLVAVVLIAVIVLTLMAEFG